MATNEDPGRHGSSTVNKVGGAGAGGTGAGTHGTSTVTPVGKAGGKKKGGLGWLWPLLGALLLLGLLLLLLRSCGDDDRAASTTTRETTTTTTGAAAGAAPAATATATPPLPVETVTLPGGRTVELEPNTLNYSLQRFLASGEAAPRTFEFDRLNFATNSAELPADASQTVSALAQILSAYPNAPVRLDGYADARGPEPANQELGARRAEAVAQALVAQGVAGNRITAASGGEGNPADTNTTAEGRAENRRTELVVRSK